MTVPRLSWWFIGGALAATSFVLRVWAQQGRRPIGLDTWYYLAYADAVRRHRSFDVRLPQYLLQDERQSYPPLFPMLLALLPASWLRRRFWAVPLLFDSLHVLLLFWATAMATGSPALGGLAAAALSLAPQSIAEPPGLHGRSLGGLLHSVAMLLALEAVANGRQELWFAAALLTGACLFLASAAMSAAFGFVLAMLTMVFLDARYLLIACAALVLAVIVSGGHYLRVVLNFCQAAQYWLRNRNLFGAHPIRHSPLYGRAHTDDRPVPLRRGLLGQGIGGQLLRLVGENPYILALPFASRGSQAWAPGMQSWAICLTTLSVLTTLAPPLKSFGLGRSYMRAALFPAAYSLVTSIREGGGGHMTPVAIATLACFGLSLAATMVVYSHRRRRQSEAEPSATDGLEQAVQCLASQPPGGFLCLPYIYAGFVSYQAGKPVLWGGHCGDLRRWEALAPVISRPIPVLMREYGVRYVLLDDSYALPREIGLEGAVDLKGRWGGFALYEWSCRD